MNLNIPKKFIYQQVEGGGIISFLNEKEESRLMTGEEIVKCLNKQQDTIFKLQDLCGKSDGENAKLRIENKRLEEEVNLLKPTNIEQYEQIVQLQKENEQLKEEIEPLKQKEEVLNKIWRTYLENHE